MIKIFEKIGGCCWYIVLSRDDVPGKDCFPWKEFFASAAHQPDLDSIVLLGVLSFVSNKRQNVYPSKKFDFFKCVSVDRD